MESMPTPHHFESVKRYIENKEVEGLLECLETLEPFAVSIGTGKNAEVFGLDEGRFRNVCAKRFYKNPELKCNDLDSEVEFQNRVRDLGVRTPLTFERVKDTDSGEQFILMERIDGITLDDIVNGTASVPERFDHRTFFDALKGYVVTMHEHNIHHRDLHERNVMIEANGMPVIIDFGTACTAFSGDEFPYREKVLMWNESTGRYELKDGYFKDDDRMLYQLEVRMRKFSQNAGKF